MPLIPWRPFWELDKWFEEEDFFPAFPVLKIKEPKMDIYEEGNNVIAEIEVPGIDPNKIEVSVKDNVLKIEGGEEKKEEEKKKGYYRKEIRKGYFKRIATLPTEVIEGKAEAVYQDGILKVIIPKLKAKKAEKPKKIKIKVKK